MMGFKLPNRTVRLIFDRDYAGLEVVAKLNISIGAYLAIQDLLAQNKLIDLIKEFARAALVEWNLETTDGQAIPATPEGILEIDPSMAARIVQEWQAAVVNPPAPFVPPSKDGDMLGGQLVKTEIE